MEVIVEYGHVFVALVCIIGFFMAWGVGANDVANAMGTSVGSKALTIKQAIIVAMVFEFAGAFLAGGQVTSTIRKGIIDPSLLTNEPHLLVYGMISALLAAGIWLLIASIKGWPVSTTHSIVGAIVGFAMAGIGIEAVKWAKVGSIAMSWVVSPLVSGTLAFLIFRTIQNNILDKEDPFHQAKKLAPIYVFFVGFIIAMVTLVKGLKHIGLKLEFTQSLLIAIAIGLLIMLVGKLLLNKVQIDKKADKKFHYASVEKIFASLMIFTACAMAFAHGSNDVANAVGPLAAVVSIVGAGGEVLQKSQMPIWILLLGGIGIVVGLATYGHKVIATVGKKITELTPSRGFSAELAAASTVVLASGTGIPISTTHTLVGAILGVGFARGIAALNLNVVGTIVMSWVVTLPAGAFLSMAFFFMLKGIFA